MINSRLNVVMGMNFELEDRSEKTIQKVAWIEMEYKKERMGDMKN